MPGTLVYDFETALKTLLNAQSDVMVLVQKWGEMLASTPNDVTFTLKGQDGTPVTYTIPNIQKVIDTIGTRTLPTDPVFDSVTLRGQSGSGRVTNGGVTFSGVSTGAHYSAIGMEHQAVEFRENATLREWPLPRCWSIPSNAHPSITVAPALQDTNILHASDFFIYADPGTSVNLSFPSYGSTQRMELIPIGASVWHVFVATKNIANAGRSTVARAVRLNIVNSEDV